jgi:MoaA/NifB/PqqE/SkfB family radical SAM enzyme
MKMRDIATLTLTHAGAALNRPWSLPIAIVFPTGRCNSRCESCAWWQTTGDNELSVREFGDLAIALRAAGTRLVVFSGGEPLLRPDVWQVAEQFRAHGMTLHLLTSGLSLWRDARQVVRYFKRVVVSLDGASPAQYRAVRGVDGFAAVAAGVARVQALSSAVRVTARSTLHRRNYRQLIALVDAARAIGVEQISFLAADLTSTAFGPRDGATLAGLALDARQAAEFAEGVERCIRERSEAFASGFIAESPERLRRLPQHYAARLGLGPFPRPQCNAPSVSVVVEADGTVRPCFFHAPVGNVRQRPLADIVSGELAAFRGAWRPSADRVCQRCVCALKLGWGAPPWS